MQLTQNNELRTGWKQTDSHIENGQHSVKQHADALRWDDAISRETLSVIEEQPLFF